jgi:diguanylate cyclase (GGDEF)-like protein
VPVELIRDDDNDPIAIRINAHEFACEEETGQTVVPKEHLIGIRLSEIPDDITIKPVESIKDHVIEINHDFELAGFRDGEASAIVEEMFRRKFWDGDVGLTPYVAALREAIDEDEATSETDFDDDGDYIFLHYEVTIREDFEMQDATAFVDGVIDRVEERADQLTHRRRDGLLGIFDRGSFEADLTYALGGKQSVALIMVDIDHFKQINDTFGHRVGDEVLRKVAKVLSDRCDGKRRVEYRYGGDELAVIFTGDDALARAREAAEAIRTDVESLRFTADDLAVTISLGVAEAGEDRDKDSLVGRADKTMYQAKEEGRN